MSKDLVPAQQVLDGTITTPAGLDCEAYLRGFSGTSYAKLIVSPALAEVLAKEGVNRDLYWVNRDVRPHGTASKAHRKLAKRAGL